MTLYVTIKCKGSKRFRVWCEELNKVNSKYADRLVKVDDKRTIYINLPYTPNNLFFAVKNADNIKDNDFEVDITQTPLRCYDIQTDGLAHNFIEFAVYFAKTCGYKNPSPRGTFLKSNDGVYTIRYMPNIVDQRTGAMISTPARIGHRTGTIEVSKNKFDRYTIPMRVMILLHEFSHKYRNPSIGLPISHESGADINGLYLYLGSGFSKVDAICVFANVFLKAQTDANIKRMRKIQDYIQRFENQEFARLI